MIHNHRYFHFWNFNFFKRIKLNKLKRCGKKLWTKSSKKLYALNSKITLFLVQFSTKLFKTNENIFSTILENKMFIFMKQFYCFFLSLWSISINAPINVRIIFGLTSTISSQSKKTVAPIFLATLIAYFAFCSFSSSTELTNYLGNFYLYFLHWQIPYLLSLEKLHGTICSSTHQLQEMDPWNLKL